MQDLRYAWRAVCGTPRLSVAASACAALGLAAALFMVALVDAVLFAAPALPDAARLVRIWTSSTTSRETGDVSYLEFRDIEVRLGTLDAVAAAARTRLAVTTDAGTERLRGESVTPNYFDLVGVVPAIGRAFTAAEHAPGGDRVVIIGHDLWQRRFAGRPDIVGQPFATRPTSRQSAGAVRTIVGVMPRGFVGTVDPDVSDFWLPIAHYEPAPLLADRLARAVWVIGRLRPGATLPALQADVASLAAALADERPDAYDRVTLVAEPFGESWRDRFRLSLITLAAAAGLLLLIACTNVATLLLARLADRQSEFHLRAALGAPRARLIRQLLAESLLIAVAGGAAGLLAASFVMQAVAASGLFALPPYVRLTIEPRTAMAGLALIGLTGLGFGVLPALLGSGAEAAQAGRDAGSRNTLGRRQRRFGRALVVAQVAFTFLLLVGATLLFRTYLKLVGGDLGYRQAHLVRLAVSPDPNVYRNPTERVALADTIKATFDAYPGVRRSTVIAGVLQPWFDDVVDARVGGRDVWRDVGRHAVGRDYLEVMGMSLVAGRDFDVGDRVAGASSALVSASLARRVAETTGREAVGQRLDLHRAGVDGAERVDVIGVVNDVAYHGPLRARPADLDLYVPIERGQPGALSIAVHTSADPAALIEPLTRELGRLAPTSPQHWVSTMEAELALQYQDARLYASLSSVYGVSASLVALFGISSVLSHAVARRRRELGVRIAIGARTADIARLVLNEGVRTLAVGIVAGAALSLSAGRLVQGLLYGVAPGDPATYLAVALGLAAAGIAACAVPSIRAARVDPLAALRSD